MTRSSWCLNDVRRRFCLAGRRNSSRSPLLVHCDDDLPDLPELNRQLIPVLDGDLPEDDDVMLQHCDDDIPAFIQQDDNF